MNNTHTQNVYLRSKKKRTEQTHSNNIDLTNPKVSLTQAAEEEKEQYTHWPQKQKRTQAQRPTKENNMTRNKQLRRSYKIWTNETMTKK